MLIKSCSVNILSHFPSRHLTAARQQHLAGIIVYCCIVTRGVNRISRNFTIFWEQRASTRAFSWLKVPYTNNLLQVIKLPRIFVDSIEIVRAHVLHRSQQITSCRRNSYLYLETIKQHSEERLNDAMTQPDCGHGGNIEWREGGNLRPH